jgi:hypothetical protein
LKNVDFFICTACGTQFPQSEAQPAQCRVCEEERQYVPPGGQSWTTRAALNAKHANIFREYSPGIIGIGTEPGFAIGQRAILLQTAHGNVLWDCIANLDAATVTLIKGLGGITAIAVSHPHFYTTMVDWAHAFDAPVYVHAADRDWISRPDPAIKLWNNETKELLPGVTLVRCGGHFPGGTVLHWSDGADGRGVLCTGDVVTVAVDRKFVSFMRSYPNLIPLSEPEVAHIGAALEPFAFDQIYGHYFDRLIEHRAKDVLRASIKRYIEAIRGERAYQKQRQRSEAMQQ